MITTRFSSLNAGEKLIYFEAAVNPILQKLLSEELITVESEILDMEKRDTESKDDFLFRLTKLKLNRRLLIDFIEINQTIIKQVQQTQQN